MNTLQQTYQIPSSNLVLLNEKFEKLNKKAKKLSLQPISYEIVETVQRKVNFEVYISYIIKVIGIEPKISGWQFLATIEHQEHGNIIRKIPNSDAISTSDYREAQPLCEHCNKVRKRKDTYLVLSEDSLIKQVGKSCLKDFLGHGSPEGIAEIMTWYTDISAILEMYTDDEWGCGRNGKGTEYYETETFLAFTAEAINRFGWVSRQKSKDSFDNILATVEVVESNFAAMRSKDDATRRRAWNYTEESIELAKKALEWWRDSYCEKENIELNDFEYNLTTAVRGDALDCRNTGIAASLISIYQRKVEDDLKCSNPNNVWIGEPKEKLENLKVNLISVKPVETLFGITYYHNFETPEGTRLLWKATSEQWQAGCTYNINATVKEHTEYRGTKQTVVLRVKEYVEKVKKTRKAKSTEPALNLS